MKGLRNGLSILLALCLTLALFAGTALAKPGKDKARGQQGKLTQNIFLNKLNDVRGHWAESSIALMGTEGIIKGYEDGSFRPENNISREEALTLLVRQLGFNASDYINTSFDPGDVSPWARPVLACALDKGLVKKDELKTAGWNKPATRNEVAMWTIRAANLENEALRYANAYLPFGDAYSIPSGVRGYIYLAFNKGIITGYPGNMFKGNALITRAEMVTVMFRARNCFELPSQNPGFRFVKGVVADVDAGNGTISVKRGVYNSSSARTDQVPVAGDAAVYLDGKRAGLEDIEKGDAVSLLIGPDGEAIVVIAKTADDRNSGGSGEDEAGYVEGDYESRTTNYIEVKVDGNYKTYRLAAGVVVKLDGKNAVLDDLKKGDQVELKIEGGEVTVIKAESGESGTGEVSGVIEWVTSTDINVKVDGSYKTYRLAAGVVVRLDGKNAVPDDLKKGYEATFTVDSGQVVSIDAVSGGRVEGILKLVDGKTIMVKVDGVYKTYTLADGVEVYLDDREKSLGDLEKDMVVTICLDSNNVVWKIMAERVIIS